MRRSIAKTLFHTFEGLEERDCIVDHFASHNTRNRSQERSECRPRDLHIGARRCHQQTEHSVVEQSHEPLRRIEKVEGMTRWWCIDHNEIELAARVELVQLLHRHIFLGATKRPGNIAIKAIVEYALR